jgi:hypothetical protein
MLLPVWITSLPKFNNRQWHYDQLVHQTEKHKSPWKPVGNNFLINDSTGEWDKFYDLFLEKTQEILGPIKLLPENSRDCWCYPSNNLYYRGGIHDHKTTSVINAVYYFSMPETTNYREGAIAFYDNNNTEVWTYKPRECDLILFPNYLRHQPLPINTTGYRFSVNMEIKCAVPDQFTQHNSIE